MKCFKTLLLFTMIFASQVFADVLIKEPSVQVQTGDIVDVRIISERETDDLKSYVHKKIEHNVYIMKYFENDGNRFYKLFISELPKDAKSSDAQEENFIFKFKGIRIKNLKSKDQSDFISLEVPTDFKLEDNKKYYIIALFVLFLVPGFAFLWKKYKTAKIRKEKARLREEKGLVLIDLIRGANTRNDFESIYYQKSEIKELLDCNELVLTEYFSHLNQVQFRKEWDESQNEELRKILNKFGIIKVRNGI